MPPLPWTASMPGLDNTFSEKFSPVSNLNLLCCSSRLFVLSSCLGTEPDPYLAAPSCPGIVERERTWSPWSFFPVWAFSAPSLSRVNVQLFSKLEGICYFFGGRDDSKLLLLGIFETKVIWLAFSPVRYPYLSCKTSVLNLRPGSFFWTLLLSMVIF